MTDLKRLSPPEIKVVAKTLILNGYSSRKVESILGIDHSSALLYAQQPTPDELKEFSTIFDNYIKEQKDKGVSLVYKRILELLPKERRMDQVIRAGEFLEGKKDSTAVQVNIKQEFKRELEEYK